MTDEKLNTMDAAGLQDELSVTQEINQNLHKLYQDTLKTHSDIQSTRIESQKQENTSQNNLRLIRSKISANKERIKSIKVLLKAEHYS